MQEAWLVVHIYSAKTALLPPKEKEGQAGEEEIIDKTSRLDSASSTQSAFIISSFITVTRC